MQEYAQRPECMAQRPNYVHSITASLSGCCSTAYAASVHEQKQKLGCQKSSPSDGTAGQPDLVPPGVAGCPNLGPASTPANTARNMTNVARRIWMSSPEPNLVPVDRT